MSTETLEPFRYWLEDRRFAATLAIVVGVVSWTACDGRRGSTAATSPDDGRWIACVSDGLQGVPLGPSATERAAEDFPGFCERHKGRVLKTAGTQPGLAQLGDEVLRRGQPAIAYLFGTFRGDRGGSRVLGVVSDAVYEMWVNGEEAHRSLATLGHGDERLLPFPDVDLLQLEPARGGARVLFRVMLNRAGSRFMVHSLAPEVARTVLRRRLLSDPSVMEWSDRAGAEPALSSRTISLARALAVTVDLRASSSSIPGLGIVSLGIDGRVVERPFFAGTAAAAAALPGTGLPPGSPAETAAVAVLLRERLALIGRHPAPREVVGPAIADTLSHFASLAPAGGGCPSASWGGCLSSYQSRLDGSWQSYRLAAPSKTAFTVAVIPRPRDDTCLESQNEGFSTMNLDEMERLRMAVNALGGAVLWPRMRNASGTLVGLAEFEETLLRGQRQAGAEGKPVYLMGRLAGATEALMLAARYPSRFAGVVAVSPTLDLTDVCGSGGFPEEKLRWLGMQNPASLADAFFNTPVVVTTEGTRVDRARSLATEIVRAGGWAEFIDRGKLAMPPEGVDPLVVLLRKVMAQQGARTRTRMSTSLLRFASWNGIRITRFLKQGTPGRLEVDSSQTPAVISTAGVGEVEILPEFFQRFGPMVVLDGKEVGGAGQTGAALRYRVGDPVRRVEPSLGVAGSPIQEGPIQAVYTQPFLVVTGNGPVDSWNSQAFRNAWRGRFGGDLAIRYGSHPQDVPETHNAVLIGTPESNALIAGLRSRQNDNSRYPPTKWWSARQAAFLVPSPWNKTQTFLVLSSPNRFDSGFVNRVAEGYGDYCVDVKVESTFRTVCDSVGAHPGSKRAM